jgi:hypothetical protein
MKHLEKMIKLVLNSETLIGLEGFKSIQVDEINEDTYLVY